MSKCPIIKARCPESFDCPCWHEVVLENPETHETKVEKNCLFRLLPVFLTEVIKASNRPAAAIESTRNELIAGLGAIAAGVHSLPDPELTQRLNHDG